MNDGNTAVQVSPIATESDGMSKIREVFDHALNSIVQATELSKQVQDLAVQVNALKADLDKLRSQNNWLDEQLTNVRATRDKALQDLATANSELAQTKAQNEGLQSRADNAERVISQLREELEQVKKDRDDAHLQAMDFEDKLHTANGTIDKIKALFPAPKPEAEAQPDPTPTPPPPAPDYHEPAEARGSHWDYAKQAYVND